MTETNKTASLEIKIKEAEVPSWRAALGTIRETKGLENVAVALSRALRASFESLGKYGELVNLDWEEFLSGQHVVMNELTKPDGRRNVGLIERSIEMMESSANRAHACISSHEDLAELEKKSYRYLGRLADYKGDYLSAIENYGKSIALFKAEEDPMIRVNMLEVAGFLGASQIMAGKNKEGLETALIAYKEYFDSEDGRYLRKTDYYTWAVWASGVPIRTVEAAIDTGSLVYKKWAEDWIEEAESLLVIPEGDTTWGDKNFSYRKDEIARIREKLVSFIIQ